MKLIFKFLSKPHIRFWIAVGALVSVVYLGFALVWPLGRWGYYVQSAFPTAIGGWHAVLLLWVFYFAVATDVLLSVFKHYYAMQLAAITPLPESLIPTRKIAEDDDAPLINTALEDALAHAPTEEDRKIVLVAWLTLGTEYAARSMPFAPVDDDNVLDRAPDKKKDPKVLKPWFNWFNKPYMAIELLSGKVVTDSVVVMHNDPHPSKDVAETAAQKIIEDHEKINCACGFGPHCYLGAYEEGTSPQ